MLLTKALLQVLGEGWWLPYTAKKHNLKTALDVLARPDLFPYSEDKSKGAFVGCPAGWGCQLAMQNFSELLKWKKRDGF